MQLVAVKSSCVACRLRSIRAQTRVGDIAAVAPACSARGTPRCVNAASHAEGGSSAPRAHGSTNQRAASSALLKTRGVPAAPPVRGEGSVMMRVLMYGSVSLTIE